MAVIQGRGAVKECTGLDRESTWRTRTPSLRMKENYGCGATVWKVTVFTPVCYEVNRSFQVCVQFNNNWKWAYIKNLIMRLLFLFLIFDMLNFP